MPQNLMRLECWDTFNLMIVIIGQNKYPRNYGKVIFNYNNLVLKELITAIHLYIIDQRLKKKLRYIIFCLILLL